MTNEHFAIRRRKKTRYYIDNELLELCGDILKPHGIAIYNVLAKHANSKTQRCFPSYETIMKQSGVGRRNTVTKYLNLLEEHNLIAIERSVGKKPNLYFLIDVSAWRINSIQKDTDRKTYIDPISSQKDTKQYPLGALNSIFQDHNSISGDTLNQRSKSENVKSDKEILSSFSSEKDERAKFSRHQNGNLIDDLSPMTASFLKKYYKEEDVVSAIRALVAAGENTKTLNRKQIMQKLQKSGVLSIKKLPFE